MCADGAWLGCRNWLVVCCYSSQYADSFHCFKLSTSGNVKIQLFQFVEEALYLTVDRKLIIFIVFLKFILYLIVSLGICFSSKLGGFLRFSCNLKTISS